MGKAPPGRKVLTMGKQSAMVIRHQQDIDEAMRTAERITRQFDVDTLQITLRRYKKLGLGYKRIMEITDLWMQVRNEYQDCIVRTPLTDVARHHMQVELLEIAKKPELVSEFEPRYPELRRVTYEPRKKR